MDLALFQMRFAGDPWRSISAIAPQGFTLAIIVLSQ
jgi:hypothetical protein